MLDEVVVVGYGTIKKANLSGAVDQISSKEIEHRISGNTGQTLQGLIPNLNVSFSDGAINKKHHLMFAVLVLSTEALL